MIERTRLPEYVYWTMVLGDTLVSGVRDGRHGERGGDPHQVRE